MASSAARSAHEQAQHSSRRCRGLPHNPAIAQRRPQLGPAQRSQASPRHGGLGGRRQVGGAPGALPTIEGRRGRARAGRGRGRQARGDTDRVGGWEAEEEDVTAEPGERADRGWARGRRRQDGGAARHGARHLRVQSVPGRAWGGMEGVDRGTPPPRSCDGLDADGPIAAAELGGVGPWHAVADEDAGVSRVADGLGAWGAVDSERPVEGHGPGREPGGEGPHGRDGAVRVEEQGRAAGRTRGEGGVG